MRSFFPGPKRNNGFVMEDPRPVERIEDDICTGSMGADGYERLSRANPRRQGDPPAVAGTIGPNHLGPDGSFEQ